MSTILILIKLYPFFKQSHKVNEHRSGCGCLTVCPDVFPHNKRRYYRNNIELIKFEYTVTCMARALLANGPVNTPRPNTEKATTEDASQWKECYFALIGNSEPMKTLARNHVTFSLSGLLYATVELRGPCSGCITRLAEYTSSSGVQFSSRQEDVVQDSSVVDVLILRVL
jgi:hypothetical protein